MGMTMTQKILAAHAGLEEVKAGQLITCKLDLVLGNDITIPPAINEFRKTGQTRVFDKDRVVMVPSHFAPNKDIKSAENCKQMRLFAGEQDITHYYEQGQAGMGIEHIIVPENGLCLPGYAMIGADSHTCTDGALGAFATGVGSTDLAYSMATGENWFRVPEAIRFVLTGELKAPLSGKDIILYIISKTLPLIICKLIYVNPIIRKKRTLMIASEFLFHVQSYISVRLSEYHLTSHFYFFMYR